MRARACRCCCIQAVTSRCARQILAWRACCRAAHPPGCAALACVSDAAVARDGRVGSLSRFRAQSSEEPMIRIAVVSMLVRDALPEEICFTVRAEPWESAVADESSNGAAGSSSSSDATIKGARCGNARRRETKKHSYENNSDKLWNSLCSLEGGPPVVFFLWRGHTCGTNSAGGAPLWDAFCRGGAHMGASIRGPPQWGVRLWDAVSEGGTPMGRVL